MGRQRRGGIGGLALRMVSPLSNAMCKSAGGVGRTWPQTRDAPHALRHTRMQACN